MKSLDDSLAGEKKQSGTRNFERADIVATGIIPYALAVVGAMILSGAIVIAGAIYGHYRATHTQVTQRENIQYRGEQR